MLTKMCYNLTAETIKIRELTILNVLEIKISSTFIDTDVKGINVTLSSLVP